jgi:hypothetical protein
MPALNTMQDQPAAHNTEWRMHEDVLTHAWTNAWLSAPEGSSKVRRPEQTVNSNTGCCDQPGVFAAPVRAAMPPTILMHCDVDVYLPCMHERRYCGTQHFLHSSAPGFTKNLVAT